MCSSYSVSFRLGGRLQLTGPTWADLGRPRLIRRGAATSATHGETQTASIGLSNLVRHHAIRNEAEAGSRFLEFRLQTEFSVMARRMYSASTTCQYSNSCHRLQQGTFSTYTGSNEMNLRYLSGTQERETKASFSVINKELTTSVGNPAVDQEIILLASKISFFGTKALQRLIGELKVNFAERFFAFSPKQRRHSHTRKFSSLRRDATTTLTLHAQRTPVFTLIHFSLLPVPLTCLMAPPRRSPRKHNGTTEKPVKSGKPKEPPIPRIEWLANKGALTWALIAQMEVKENRLVLFGKQEKMKCVAKPFGNVISPDPRTQKSVGDNKIAVYKRIGSQILPEYFKTSPNALAKRVKGKAEDLVSTYKELAKELQVTGGGHENDDEGNDVHQYLECYISSEGPDHDTTPKTRNIWEKLEKEFKFFPALHKFLAARSNIVPPMVATGVGPKGRTVIHLQPPTESQNTINDDCIDPALRAPQTPVPDKDADEPAGSSPITIPSSPSPPAPEEKPSRRKTAAQPSTFQRAVDRAKSATIGHQSKGKAWAKIRVMHRNPAKEFRSSPHRNSAFPGNVQCCERRKMKQMVMNAEDDRVASYLGVASYLMADSNGAKQRPKTFEENLVEIQT
ncbi:hypothetical protein C8R45DRAFT_929312 [Mycena sanguinolenta]|nr:hypothetical protein C8R45DRAFT_929312 [Mycena sanguinolenta]